MHPNLALLIEEMGKTRDLVVLEGARSIADEREAMASGHSDLKNPMDSKHVIDVVMRPLALAVDVAPDPVNWKDIAAFQALETQVKAKAQELGLAVRCGGDWAHLKDYPHYELAEG